MTPDKRSAKLAAIERRVSELIDIAPPLTPEQLDKLSMLLRKRAT